MSMAAKVAALREFFGVDEADLRPVGQLKGGIHSIESIDEIPHLRQSWGRTGSPILKSCGTRTLPPPRRPADAHGGDSKDRNFDMYRLSRRFIVYMRGGIHILYIIKPEHGPRS